MNDVYIRKEEALQAIMRLDGVVKLSTSTIRIALDKARDPDAGRIIHCEQCANYHERVVDVDTIVQFEHCQKGIRFDDPRTFYCGYSIRRG